MAFTTNLILLTFYVGIVALVRVVLLLWKTHSSPLRSVPGPWHGRVVNWRLKWAVLTGCRVHYIHRLHKRYGPIVRISPDEVAVADAASHREIYRMGSGFNKADWYMASCEDENSALAIFNMTDPKMHAARKKLMAKGFSQRLLREHWEPVIKERCRLAVKCVREDVMTNGVADVLKWWTFMATDISSALLFGECFHMLELGYKVPFVDALHKSLIQITLRWEVPLLYSMLKRLPLASLQPILRATDSLQEQGNMAIQESRARGISANSMFATMIKESEKEGTSLTNDDLRVEAGNFIVAGSDTTANTLTYFTWAVIKRPGLYRQLLEELDNVEIMTDDSLERLPVLNAAIDECLRLYGAVPATLPRRTPEGGITLHGHYIPEGTIVGAQAFSVHRNPDVFPDPERFDHTRFLPTTSLSPMSRASFVPFGAGSNVCLGIQLARMELRMAIALFFTECRTVRLAASATDECMELENFFIVTPRGHRCEILL